ncbi:MAG: ABC transporter permease subunit [Candidatus Odinarchaeota archaeon]
MTSVKQYSYLLRQELRSASRSRYLVISFVFGPFFFWGLYSGALVLASIAFTPTSSDTLYITNEDVSLPVNLTAPLTLPFDFGNSSAGTTVTEIQLAQFLIATIDYTANTDKNSTIYNVQVQLTNTSHVQSLASKGKVRYWLDIPANFSTTYSQYNHSVVTLNYLQTGLGISSSGPALFQVGIDAILSQPPFSIYYKTSVVTTGLITVSGEKPSPMSSYGAGLVALIGTMVAVFVPGPFISSSFAGEREKKTMESLLALPLTRRSIFVGKLSAGMVLVLLFTAMNIVGMATYNFVLTTFTSPVTTTNGFSVRDIFVINLDVVSTIAIALSLFLSAFTAIGIGISVASLTKDVRTSESVYQLLLLIPALVVGLFGMFIGLPEEIGGAALLLYFIPWAHTTAIFIEVSKPEYYNVKSLLGFGLIPDILFHLLALVAIVGIFMAIATKIFDREGIVS